MASDAMPRSDENKRVREVMRMTMKMMKMMTIKSTKRKWKWCVFTKHERSKWYEKRMWIMASALAPFDRSMRFHVEFSHIGCTLSCSPVLALNDLCLLRWLAFNQGGSLIRGIHTLKSSNQTDMWEVCAVTTRKDMKWSQSKHTHTLGLVMWIGSVGACLSTATHRVKKMKSMD